MTKEAPEWARVGAEMIEVRRGWGRATYGDKPVTISARLRNGNIRIEGFDCQWNCSGDGRAHKAGDGGYRSRTSYELVTPALMAEIERERNVAAAKRKIQAEADRLEKIWRHGDDDEILATHAALASTKIEEKT